MRSSFQLNVLNVQKNSSLVSQKVSSIKTAVPLVPILFFLQSVDLYLQDCLELGKEPNKPFKGVFNVRIGEELHREATIIAGDRSLNAFVTEAIQEKIFREKPSLR